MLSSTTCQLLFYCDNEFSCVLLNITTQNMPLLIMQSKVCSIRECYEIIIYYLSLSSCVSIRLDNHRTYTKLYLELTFEDKWRCLDICIKQNIFLKLTDKLLLVDNICSVCIQRLKEKRSNPPFELTTKKR